MAQAILLGLISTFILGAQAISRPACDLLRSNTLAESGRRSFEQRRYDAAASDFRQALEACPQQRLVLLELARSLTYDRKFEEAERAANEFLASQPQSEQGLLILANVYFLSRRFAECQKVVEKLLSRNPKNSTALKLKAHTHYLASEDPEAIQTLQTAIEIDPKDEEALYSLGRIYYQQNRFEPAIAQFKRVLELNPKSYKGYDNLGLCYEALNQDQEAIGHYTKALDLVHKDHPDYDWPYANLANLMLKRGEDEKAFQLAAEAAQRNPNSARNFYLTAKALSRLDKADTAIKWLKQSIELDPIYPEPRYLLGQLYSKRGMKEEAQKELQVFQELQAKQPRRKR